MANDYFRFKRFTVHQNICAMKVGTDGTLLGAWAQAPENPCRILDVGTGTGLIALMMAQRYPLASIVGIDIDSSAVAQANSNVKASPFHDQIRIYEADICHYVFHQPFDVIICNPPYFDHDLICPNNQRAMARHAITLSYHDLIHAAYSLLKDEGAFSVIIPSNNRTQFESEAILTGFNISRICHVKTTTYKAPKRCLIELLKNSVSERVETYEVIEETSGVRSQWYHHLTQDFYIK